MTKAFLFVLTAILLAPAALASSKPVDLRFRGYMCADVPYTVTLNGVTLDGEGESCSYYSPTPWGTAKIVPDQEYTISTGGALCSTHIPFEKKCYRLFVKGDPYEDWTETEQINKYQTFDAEGNPNKDAGGSWQIVLTMKDRPGFGGGSNQLGSVAVSLSLGSLPSGIPAGTLRLATESIDTSIYTPAALQAATLSADVEVLTSGANLRQVYTWDGLVDIVSVSGGYEARFYSLADVGAKGGDGFYTINTGATTIATWGFVNPDQSATNRLRVTETRGGAVVAVNTYSQTGTSWGLDKSVNSQVRATTSKASEVIGGEPVEVVTETRYSSPTASEVTVTRTYTDQASAHLADRVQSVELPDGRKDTYVYETGTYNSSTRTFTPGVGPYLRTLISHGTAVAPGLIANKSTQDAIVSDVQGLTLLEELYAYTGSAFSRITHTWHTYDNGSLVASSRDGQPVYSATWDWGYKTGETDAVGIETVIEYDYGTYYEFIKKGVAAEGTYAAQPDIETYGSRGDYSEETVSSGGLTTLTATSVVNGRIDYEISNGLQTNYSYATSGSGGLITTITRPGGGTEIRETYADGKIKSVTGTSVTAEFYTYGVDGDGNDWTRIAYGTENSTNYLKSTFDWLGRVIREERPAYTGTFVQQYFYNNKGQLWKETATGLADRLTEYDELGNQLRRGLDMDANGALVLASLDRIESSETTYQQTGADWYRVTTRATFRTDNSAMPTSFVEKERLTLPVNVLSEIRLYDPNNNETVRTQVVDRPAKLVTETLQAPGSTTPQITITRNGLVQSVSSTSVATPMTFGYDALGRRTTISDPRAGVSPTVITYDDGDYATDRIASITAGAHSIVNVYYTAQEAHSGLLKSRTTNGKTTYFEYDARGQNTRTWGEDAYPQWNEYDAFGRLWKLHTYRNDAEWNTATWPANAGSGDVTIWSYQETTGLLISKTDAANKTVSYTYKPFGHVETRTWARQLSTTYSYNLAAEVSGIDYSDTTPDITVLRDRAGQPNTVTDAAGVHTLGYSSLGQLTSDAIGGTGILANVTVSVGYDTLFRKQTLDASFNGTALLAQQTVGYDAATGRVQNLGDGTVSATYSYLPDSDWIHTITSKRGTDTVLTATRGPDTLTRLLSVTNSVTGQPASGSSFTYRYDTRGLRDKLTLADNSYWSYGYNDRAEVTSGQRFWPDTSAVDGMQFAYTFDAIGNRTSTNVNGRAATYQPDGLNQYTSRGVPGALDVLGEAAPTATVTVNNQPTTRKDGYFAKTLSVDNANSAAFPLVTIVGVKNNVGAAGEDAVTTASGSVFVPKTPEAFAYDDDGNLTADGRWSYTWDGENRLASMTSLADAPVASKRKLTFDYDAEGRRIRKTVYQWSTATNSYQQAGELRFVYDRWNLIAEINSANAPVRSYIWGLDVSGTLGEAHGVSGLLAVVNQQSAPTKHHFAAFDGLGNVTSLIDVDTGVVAGRQLYGPSGELLSRTGTFAAICPIGFSTRYADLESGMIYYGNRFYNASTGRWLSRDPIEELGGSNLYGFVFNAPLTYYDDLGNQPSPWPPPPPGSSGGARRPPGPGPAPLPPPDPKPNQGGYGPVRNSKHEVDICFTSGTVEENRQQIYRDLKRFNHFEPNIATVSVSGNVARFTPKGLKNSWGSYLIGNDFSVYVILTFLDAETKVTGRTANSHMLVGTRHWEVKPTSAPWDVVVRTSASERSSNWFNEMARNYGGGNEMQSLIWTRYLKNIGEFWKGKGAVVSEVRVQ